MRITEKATINIRDFNNVQRTVVRKVVSGYEAGRPVPARVGVEGGVYIIGALGQGAEPWVITFGDTSGAGVVIIVSTVFGFLTFMGWAVLAIEAIRPWLDDHEWQRRNKTKRSWDWRGRLGTK